MYRIGKISSINYAAGTARVLYPDRDNSVTDEFPMLANGIYYPLKVDDYVYVLHQSNDSSSGLILGRAWSDANIPPEGEDGVYRQDFSRVIGDGYEKYDAETNTLTIHANVKIVIETDGDVEITAANSITIDASDGDVTINGISLLHHLHPTPSGLSGEPT